MSRTASDLVGDTGIEPVTSSVRAESAVSGRALAPLIVRTFARAGSALVRQRVRADAAEIS